MCRVKSITWPKTGSSHQRSRPLDHGTVGELQLEGKRVHRVPGARKATPHGSHHRLSILPIPRERVPDAVVTQPGENQPVGELVEDQCADHATVDCYLGEDSLTPIVEGRRCLRALRSQVNIEKIRVEITATQGARTARSSPESTSSSLRPARISSSSPGSAWPAEPAVLIHACAGSGRLAHSAPGVTPNVDASRAIVSRSTRVARPVRMLRAVLSSSPAALASCRAPQPRCSASSATLQAIVVMGTMIPLWEDAPRGVSAQAVTPPSITSSEPVT
jgi:hypothetical protein